MVVGIMRIPLDAAQRTEVLEVLQSVRGPVLAQPGCKAYSVFEERGEESAVVLVERWESKTALESHIRSEAYRRILCAIELAGAPPEVSFEVVSAREGMELVERLRRTEPSDRAS